jgi:hypothetical protein
MRIGGETQPGRLSDNAIPLRVLPARHRFPKKHSKPLIRVSERRWYILTAAKYTGCTIICNINRYFSFCSVCVHLASLSVSPPGHRECHRQDVKTPVADIIAASGRCLSSQPFADPTAALHRSKRKLLRTISPPKFSSAPLRLLSVVEGAPLR